MMVKKHLYNIAHRGARSLAPENTMAAIRKAWLVGAHGFETDISVSADGRLFLYHDPTLERTTNAGSVFPERTKEPVHTFTWEELKQLDAGSWFFQDDPFGTVAAGAVGREDMKLFTGEPIPLLEEALFFVKEKSWFINIEIKHHTLRNTPCSVVEDILDLVETVGLSGEMFCISSFHHPFLHTVQDLRPDIEINALIGGDESQPQDWGNYEFEIYNANVSLMDSDQLNKAANKGCRVNLYTVNDPKLMDYYLKQGVEKIITDFPQVLASAGGPSP